MGYSRALFAFGVAIATLSPAFSSVTDFTLFVNTTYNQTSGNPPAFAGYWISLGGGMQNPGDFNTASVTYPGPGSPANLPVTGTSFGLSSPFFPTIAALQGQYPFGTYTYTATNTNTNTSQVGALDYTANLFTSNIPALNNLIGLTGLNPAVPFSVGFNSFTPAPGSSEGLLFFTVYDANTGNIVFTQGFLPPSTTSVTIPANTLQANHGYNFELDFSDRLHGFDSAHGTFTEQGFDLRTDGSFQTGAAVTGVPEPASAVLLLGALVALGAKRSRAIRA